MPEKKDYCKLVTIRYELKQGTKTVYIVKEMNEELIDEQHYINCVDASPFFRRLGGSERKESAYTKRGYKVVQITSKSPDRKMKTVRMFDFDI